MDDVRKPSELPKYTVIEDAKEGQFFKYEDKYWESIGYTTIVTDELEGGWEDYQSDTFFTDFKILSLPVPETFGSLPESRRDKKINQDAYVENWFFLFGCSKPIATHIVKDET